MTAPETDQSLRHLPPLRAGFINAGLSVLIVLAGRFDAPVAVTTVALVVTVGVATVRLPWQYAVLTGLTAWACLTGFVVNELGQLTFAGADLLRLLVLVAVSVAAAGVYSQPTRRNTAYSAAPTRTMSTIANG